MITRNCQLPVGLQHRELALRVESVTDTGIVEGYASAYNVLEPGYNTIMDEGCFDKTIKKRGPEGIQFLLQHGRGAAANGVDVNTIAGDIQEISTDKKGLRFKAQCDLELSYMADPWRNIQKKRLKGISIGFNVVSGYEEIRDKTPKYIMHFTELDVPELSLVVFQANPGAGITKVREIADPETMETFLREAGGFSRQQAKDLVHMMQFGARQREVGIAEQQTIVDALIPTLRAAQGELESLTREFGRRTTDQILDRISQGINP